ncbi:hypothetical protein SAZ11_01695 [Streptomyces sp. FXJ1.4098]|nr:hypothetical protein [Streptomyces sp. FXJ1.4098]
MPGWTVVPPPRRGPGEDTVRPGGHLLDIGVIDRTQAHQFTQSCQSGGRSGRPVPPPTNGASVAHLRAHKGVSCPAPRMRRATGASWLSGPMKPSLRLLLLGLFVRPVLVEVVGSTQARGLGGFVPDLPAGVDAGEPVLEGTIAKPQANHVRQ